MVEFPYINRQEIIADVLYVFVSMLVATILIFVFDIHWSLYPGETIYPPSRRVFGNDLTPYYIGVPLGGLVGFFILKLIFFAFAKERRAHHIYQKQRKGRKKPL